MMNNPSMMNGLQEVTRIGMGRPARCSWIIALAAVCWLPLSLVAETTSDDLKVTNLDGHFKIIDTNGDLVVSAEAGEVHSIEVEVLNAGSSDITGPYTLDLHEISSSTTAHIAQVTGSAISQGGLERHVIPWNVGFNLNNQAIPGYQNRTRLMKAVVSFGPGIVDANPSNDSATYSVSPNNLVWGGNIDGPEVLTVSPGQIVVFHGHAEYEESGTPMAGASAWAEMPPGSLNRWLADTTTTVNGNFTIRATAPMEPGSYPMRVYATDSSVMGSGDFLVNVLGTDRFDLTVVSPYGTPSPLPGVTNLPDGSTMQATLSGSPAHIRTFERAIATGWTGTGSVPSSGTGLLADFILREDSSITWLWDNQYYLAVNAYASGTVTQVSGWYSPSDTVQIEAYPDPGARFIEWAGDPGHVPVGQEKENPLMVTMDQARILYPVFGPLHPPEGFVMEATKDTMLSESTFEPTEGLAFGDAEYCRVRNWDKLRTITGLVEFDLTAMTGMVITSETVRLELFMDDHNLTHDSWNRIALSPVLLPWDEQTTDAFNFGGIGFDPSRHLGANVFTRDLFYNPSEGWTDQYVPFELPASLVQGWIDDPSFNHGLAVEIEQGSQLVFRTREYTGSRPPRLVFSQTNSAPDQVTDLAVSSVSKSSVSLEWTDIDGEESYLLFGRDHLGDWSTIATLPAGTTNYVETGLAPNFEHLFSIRGVNGVGNAIDSNVATGRTMQVTNVYYVVKDNPGASVPYQTWATAAANIQDAVDEAVVGATVVVSNGVYDTGVRTLNGANSRVVVDKQLSLQAFSADPADTIIEGAPDVGGNDGLGPAAVRGIYLAELSSLTGFTVRNGHTAVDGEGGGILCADRSVRVVNCVVSNNAAGTYGGGMWSGAADRCLFIHNSGVASGLYRGNANHCRFVENVSSPSISNIPWENGALVSGTAHYCEFVRNQGSAGWLTAYNTLFLENTSDSYGGAIGDGNAYNCTFVRNQGPEAGAMASGEAFNCIFWNNVRTGGTDNHDIRDQYVRARNSRLTGISQGELGSITDDPLFVSSTDFRLQPTSPCIDLGYNVNSFGATDLDGTPRILDGDSNGSLVVDMGVYEARPRAPDFNDLEFEAVADTKLAAEDLHPNGIHNKLLVVGNPESERSTLLVRFDVSSLSGLVVTGETVELEMHHSVLYPPILANSVPSISLRSVLQPWDEDTVTHANYAGVGFDESVHLGDVLSSRLVIGDIGIRPHQVSRFSIPSSVVQGWIDDPASNHGMALVSDLETGSQEYMWFLTRESDVPPKLVFNPPPRLPEAVTDLQVVSVGDRSFTLAWTDVEGEGAYRIYYADSPNGNWRTSWTLPENRTSYTVTGLQPETEYRYMVVTQTSRIHPPTENILSDPSNIVTVRTLAAIPQDHVVEAVADTEISKLQESSGQGPQGGQWEIMLEGGGLLQDESLALLKFDLSSVEGRTIPSDTVQLEVFIDNSYGDSGAHSISVHPVLHPWDEGTVTYGNFGGDGFDRAQHLGDAVYTRTIIYDGSPDWIDQYVTFELPASLVKTWMDHPAANHGVALVSNEGEPGSRLFFHAKEHGSSVPPRLVFNSMTDLPPTQVTDLTAEALPEGSIFLSWSDADGEDLYGVYRQLGEGQWERVAELPVDTTSYVDARVPFGVKLLYMIRGESSNRFAIVSNVATGSNVNVSHFHYVAKDNPGAAWPFTSWATAASNIQDAVDAAEAGDLVLVTNGVYNTGGVLVGAGSLTNRVAITKPIKVKAVSADWSDTVIEGAMDPVSTNGLGPAAVRCVYMVDGATLEGFTLRSGHTSTTGSGGAVWCESELGTVADCLFTGNSAQTGGGMRLGTAIACMFTNNHARFGGAGWAITADDCVFSGNEASVAAGAMSWGTARNSSFFNNMATNSGGGGKQVKAYDCEFVGNIAGEGGGGLTESRAFRCSFVSNRASRGGGGYLLYQANDCVFETNIADVSGGGVHNEPICETANRCIFIDNRARSGAGAFRLDASHCVFVGNKAEANAGGMSGGRAVHCTLTNNEAGGSGGGIYYVNAYNSIIWGNHAGSGSGHDVAFHSNCEYSCSPGLAPGVNGNINENPRFVSETDLSLRLDSPCINAANNDHATKPLDLAGKPRIFDDIVDMGAYEFIGFLGGEGLGLFGPASYNPGEILSITNVFQTDSSNLLAMLVLPDVPDGWTVLSAHAEHPLAPLNNEIVWGTLPSSSPVTLVYSLQTATNSYGSQAIGGANYQHYPGDADPIEHQETPLLLVMAPVDMDQDGLPDNWENLYSGGGTNLLPNVDLDGDGMNNLAELIAGTDPTTPSSALQVLEVDSQTGGVVRVFWASEANRSYRVCTLSLADGTVSPVQSNIPATPPVNSLELGAPPNEAVVYCIEVEE